jgi:hypothetical protein
MVNEVAAVLLDQHHLGDKLTGLPGEALLPDHRDRIRATKDGNELPLGEVALGALVVLTDPLQLLPGQALLEAIGEVADVPVLVD